MIKLSYRPEIDGLRAISVIAVIFYHIEIVFNDLKLFSGGYIGVDVFFCDFRIFDNFINIKRNL